MTPAAQSPPTHTTKVFEDETVRDEEDGGYSQQIHKWINDYQFDTVLSLLESLDQNERRRLASIPDENGDLPLHMCLKRNAPDDVILCLLDSYRESVAVPAGLGTKSLPLHLAAIHCASARVVVSLIRRFPDALDSTDEDGDTPRSCVRRALDPVARDAILKPTEYWTSLLSEVAAEAEERASRIHEDRIAALEDRLMKLQSELEATKQREAKSSRQMEKLEERLSQVEIEQSSHGSASLRAE